MAPGETCWTVIEAAADGDPGARSAFARAYLEVVRVVLSRRWARSPLRDAVEDGVQEVFADCFKAQGPLSGLDREHPSGFRGFLFGVTRIVALRFEEGLQRDRRRQEMVGSAEPSTEDDDLARSFDREWARALVRQAAHRHQDASVDERAWQRCELLRLRFSEGVPVREIATRWAADPAFLHHELARARTEFRQHLLAEIAFHRPQATPGEVERECRELLELL
ncbi:MAG: sigma-70 family RNA polymerase sigma factor [Planctomycetes bacterium]|nr:sigma-70 family RNA polymerase sigma factor [Planctomycetota bacterium]